MSATEDGSYWSLLLELRTALGIFRTSDRWTARGLVSAKQKNVNLNTMETTEKHIHIVAYRIRFKLGF